MNRTRRRQHRRARKAAADLAIIALLAAMILLAFAQAEGLLTVSGHDLAREYSATNFYPPEN